MLNDYKYRHPKFDINEIRTANRRKDPTKTFIGGLVIGSVIGLIIGLLF